MLLSYFCDAQCVCVLQRPELGHDASWLLDAALQTMWTGALGAPYSECNLTYAFRFSIVSVSVCGVIDTSVPRVLFLCQDHTHTLAPVWALHYLQSFIAFLLYTWAETHETHTCNGRNCLIPASVVLSPLEGGQRLVTHEC